MMAVKGVFGKGLGFSGGVVDSRPSGVDSRPYGVDSHPSGVEFRLFDVDSRPCGLESRPSGVEVLPVALGILSSIAPLRSFHLPRCSSWATIGAGVTSRENLGLTSPFLSHLSVLDEAKASRTGEPCE